MPAAVSQSRPGSGLMPEQRMLDTIREVLTPEGVGLHLHAAGPFPRALAWGIDALIRFALLIPASLVSGLFGKFGMGLYLLWLFVLMWGYPIAFEVLQHGQTPGKRALGLRVVAADGAPVGWLASIVRNLMRTVDMLPLGYATGIVCGLADPWGRRLGDMVGGTLVVHVDRPVLHAAASSHGLAAASAPVPLLASEQAALIAFADRAEGLGSERQHELAALVPDLAGPVDGHGPQRLRAMAAGLLGR